MKKVSFTKELAAFTALGNWGVHAALTLSAVLTYNIVDPILPFFARSVSIEKKGFAVASVSRFLGRTKVKYVSRRDHSDGGTDFLQPDILSAGLPLAFDELGVSLKSGAIALTIPTDWVLARNVVLPSIVKENLEEVVAQELDRITPLSLAGCLLRFSNNRRGRENDPPIGLCREDGNGRPVHQSFGS